jgi:serine/threonine-protein kinase
MQLDLKPLLAIIKQDLPNLQLGIEVKTGGQKAVIRGKLPPFGDIVLKIISASNKNERDRAIREIEVASKFDSSYFAKPYLWGELKIDFPIIYLVEEFIPGLSLREILLHQKPVLLQRIEVKRIVENILKALSIIEKKNKVHRDIKPENIMVSNDRIVLIDFGIARDLDMSSLTDSYAIFGPMTPGYAAPEQIKNEKRKISIRTDLFSVGVLTYELLTGYNPFVLGAQSAQETVARTLSVNPDSLTNLGFQPEINSFVNMCLQKAVHRRPASVEMALYLFNKIDWGF